MVNDEFILRAMDLAGEHGGLIQLHCENGEVIHYLELALQAEGRVLPTDFPNSAPPWVEGDAVNRAISLARTTGCPTYIVHLSTGVGLDAIKRAQADGQNIWTETCPQYLLLAAEDHEKWGPLLKIGPPLRSREGTDSEMLWAGLEHGAISCIGSDHSPHPKELKELGRENVFYQPNGDTTPSSPHHTAGSATTPPPPPTSPESMCWTRSSIWRPTSRPCTTRTTPTSSTTARGC